MVTNFDYLKKEPKFSTRFMEKDGLHPQKWK